MPVRRTHRLATSAGAPTAAAPVVAARRWATDATRDRRAAKLTNPRHRSRLAATLRRFVAEAHDPLAIVLSSSPPLAREPVRESRELLTAIADRLADDRPASTRGLAMAHDLVTSPRSPLYPPSPDGALARAAAETLSALGDR